MSANDFHRWHHHADPVARRPHRSDEDEEFLVLVAIGVRGRTSEAAERALHKVLPRPGALVDCWWVAEDERHDGSDNDSAIFVPRGSQDRGDAAVRAHGLTS